MKKLLLFATLWIGAGFVSCEKAKDIEIEKDPNKEFPFPEGWKRFKYTLPSDPLATVKLVVNKDGVPFIVTGGIIYKLSGETFESIKITGAPDAFLATAMFDKGNNLYIAYEDKGICRWDGTNWTRLNIDKRFGALFTDKDGTVFAGDNYGLYKYDGSQFVKINGYDKSATAITQDNAGAIWFATENGSIVKYSDPTFTTFKAGTDFPEGLPPYLDVAEADASGNVYFTHGYRAGGAPGTRVQATVLKFSGTSGTLIHPPDPTSEYSGLTINSDGVLALAMAGSNLWSIVSDNLVGYFDGAVPLRKYVENNTECDCKGRAALMWDVKTHENKVWALSFHDDDNTTSTMNFGKPESGYLYSSN